MVLTIRKSAAKEKGEEDAAAKTVQTVQERKKCKYCNYEHWDDVDLKFHEEQHKEYCQEKQVKRQKRREYELMLIRRFNLKKEIRSLYQSFTANEIDIKDYETEEDTKELAYEVRERAWEYRARENWSSDTSFVNEYLELGDYVLTDRERELAAELGDYVLTDRERELAAVAASLYLRS
jgi:hypothetical protein